jgi:hypothetical protein
MHFSSALDAQLQFGELTTLPGVSYAAFATIATIATIATQGAIVMLAASAPARTNLLYVAPEQSQLVE